MKIKKSLFIGLLAALLPWTGAEAATLFNENFDGSPYSDNKRIDDPAGSLTGADKLSYGQWGVNNLKGGTVTTSTASSLSGTRSLALTANAEGDSAQAIGQLGLDGHNALPTSEAIVVKFAFNLQDPTHTTYFLLRDVAGANLGYLTLGGADSTVKAIFNGAASTVGIVAADTWYNIELTLSANPGTGTNKYSVSLYNADGSAQIGTTLTGAFGAASAGSGYKYFTAYNQGYKNQTSPFVTYIDNISVETIPEASSIVYGLIGGAGLLLLFNHSRRSRISVA